MKQVRFVICSVPASIPESFSLFFSGSHFSPCWAEAQTVVPDPLKASFQILMKQCSTPLELCSLSANLMDKVFTKLATVMSYL